METSWQFWIDVGGTFTDCIGVDPQGQRHFAKVLSSGQVHGLLERRNEKPPNGMDASGCGPFWGSRELSGYAPNFWEGKTICLPQPSGQERSLQIVSSNEKGQLVFAATPSVARSRFTLPTGIPAPLFAIRRILGLPFGKPLPEVDIRLGTTRGTNALLTRTGARVALVTTRGFGDLLRIGFQNRPDIFAVDVIKPEPLFEKSIEISQRVHFDGVVEEEIDPEEVRRKLQQARDEGIESLAICLMHGYRYTDQERVIAGIASEMGFREISLSHQVAPEIRIIPRAFTTVLDAYLNPVLRKYLQEIRDHLSPGTRLELFSSSGSLVAAERFTGKDSLLSGPAGGVVGFSRTAVAAGIEKTIGFDMGGTSTDVARFDGEYHYQYESEKSGVLVVAPTLSIETVAAGGGSICRFEDGRLTVGPQSAGADPGPACYGRGGPLCLSDINLFCNRINEGTFPFPLDREKVREKLSAIRQRMIDSGHPPRSLEWIARGFLKIAVAKTAEAIRLVSVQKGYDVKSYTLVGFGGAAGQIGCQVADELEIERILVHPQSSILSALGIGLADRSLHASRGIYCPLDETTQLEPAFNELQTGALADSPYGSSARILKRVDLRYRGTESYLTLDYRFGMDIQAAFEDEHQRRFGYLQEAALEIGSIRLEARFPSPRSGGPSIAGLPPQKDLAPIGDQQLIDRSTLQPGQTVCGPALVCDALTTTVLDPGWKASCLPDNQLLLERSAPRISGPDSGVDVDEIQLELFNHQLFSIAEQMGETLRATAVSVNVKERLDFSCAIFDAAGNLVANAPHIPIHLGAMSECVKGILEDNNCIGKEDVFVTNDPYRGGSHLPDVTVATPCFDSKGGLIFWVASRAHHAEIGGKVPGSMPADSTCLEEEGVLIRNFKVVDSTGPRFDALHQLLTSGRFPSRQPETNLSDIRAQIAANRRGAEQLGQLFLKTGGQAAGRLIDQLFRLSANRTVEVMGKLVDGPYQFEDFLDCGAKIRLQVAVESDRLVFDFHGSSPVLPNNLNANRAIVQSAVIYCLRLLIGKDIPLNQGILDPVEIVLPECFLNPKPHPDPARCPAIVGGNVETSQRVVDVIFGALRIAAASQGTSNNVVFGDDSFGYYETVCGGSGASANRPGADAVQVHITNTRITDPEILETRYPVILDEFSIRAGSGGAGKHRGGNGVTRRLRFRKPLQLTVLANRQKDHAPFGMQGGEPGEKGSLHCERDGESFRGLRLETPGGGGWGKAGSEE